MFFSGPVWSTYPTACPPLARFQFCSRKIQLTMCVGCEDELFAVCSLNHRHAQASSLIIFHTDPTYLCLLLFKGVRGHLTTLSLTGRGLCQGFLKHFINMISTNQLYCFCGCQFFNFFVWDFTLSLIELLIKCNKILLIC